MKPWKYYSDNPAPYPSPKSFRVTYWYMTGKLFAKQVPGDGARLAPDFETLATSEQLKGLPSDVDNDDAAYSAAKQKYQEEASRLTKEFQDDCFEELGIKDDARRFVMYSEAYDRGHSAGHSEVYSCLGDIVDFVHRLDEVIG